MGAIGIPVVIDTNKPLADLIATIRARAGRQNDTQFVTASFVMDAINEAQVDIVRRSPGLLDLDVKDETTFQIATDDTEINIAPIDPAHIHGIWILNGEETKKEGLTYVQKDDFFAKYTPVSSQSEGEPEEYTRQGNKLIFNCPVASDYNGLYLKINYTRWAVPFLSATSTKISDLSNSNKGLINFALAEIYDALSLVDNKFSNAASIARAKYEQWLSDYQNYNEVCLEELE